jgi:signal transduction histidine kinase
MPGLHVRGDRELLTQLFANLIENAIRYSPPGAKISIEATATPGEVLIVVADNGPGIPVAFRSKVLERFYRLEASRTTPGNGLGLSLVAAVATLHEAAIELQDNKPGLKCRLRFHK